MMPTLPLTGRCGCGAVRYEIRAAPTALYRCHCTDCQKQTGSAFALSMFVPRQGLVVTAGAPRVWRRRADSGNLMGCFFCADCGTRLYHEPDSRPQVTVVKPGTLDDTRWLVPVGDIWTRSKQPWIVLPPDTIAFAEHGDPALLAEAWRAAQDGANA